MNNKISTPFLFLFFIILAAGICNTSRTHAQCVPVSGDSGTIYANTVAIGYTVAVSPGASISNLGPFDACGITFPGINAPWCGNTNVIDTVKYTFSIPLVSLDIMIGYTGVTGQVHPESFTFLSNGSVPSLTVNSGSCAAWIVAANMTTSPSIIDGLNAIVHVSS